MRTTKDTDPEFRLSLCVVSCGPVNYYNLCYIQFCFHYVSLFNLFLKVPFNHSVLEMRTLNRPTVVHIISVHLGCTLLSGELGRYFIVMA